MYRDTGQQIWSVQLPQLDGVAGAVSRVSPAVHGGGVIIGDIDGVLQLHNGANLMALNRQTGKTHWKTQVDEQGMVIVTGSPVVYRDVVYVGISSDEEIPAIPPSCNRCTFRSVAAVDANTGKALWKTYTIPPNVSLIVEILQSRVTRGFSGQTIRHGLNRLPPPGDIQMRAGRSAGHPMPHLRLPV